MGSFSVNYDTWYNSLPEFEIEGLWGCVIEDCTGNKYSVSFENNTFDNFIQSVSIPQLTLEMDSTSFGMINFKEKSPYDDVTLTFYDDFKGSCMNFFTKWMSYVYDEANTALQPNWRYEAKNIFVEYYRKFTNGVVKPVTQYEMKKCLPKSLAEVSAEEEAGDRKTFSVTLAVQRVKVTTGSSISSKATN